MRVFLPPFYFTKLSSLFRLFTCIVLIKNYHLCLFQSFQCLNLYLLVIKRKELKKLAEKEIQLYETKIYYLASPLFEQENITLIRERNQVSEQRKIKIIKQTATNKIHVQRNRAKDFSIDLLNANRS